MRCFFTLLSVLSLALSIHAEAAYECQTSTSENFNFNILLQGRSLEWSYGVITGQSWGGVKIGSPLGYWQNPERPNEALYHLYILTEQWSGGPHMILAIQYRSTMNAKDAVLLHYSQQTFKIIEKLKCTH